MNTRSELQDRIDAAAARVHEDAETDLASVERANPVVQEGAGVVFALRLPPHLLDQVRAIASDRGVGASTLMREWIAERLQSAATEDLPSAVDRLARDVEQVRRLSRAS